MPRHYAAENTCAVVPRVTTGWGFNEAAALRRGKPGIRYIHDQTYGASMAAALRRGKPRSVLQSVNGRASMRPRHYAAENADAVATFAYVPCRCFNEAAALRRGKQHVRAPSTVPDALPSFNEAAALRRGKPSPARSDRRRRSRAASMRPRHYAAENPAVAGVCRHASMWPLQ